MQFVALLRGINVGGRNKLPMAELRSACATLGWGRVMTYIQSGNVIFEAGGGRAEHEAALQNLILSEFSLDIRVIARDAAEWSAYPTNSPFSEAAKTEPNRLMLCLSKFRRSPVLAKRSRSEPGTGSKFASSVTRSGSTIRPGQVPPACHQP